MYCVYYWFSSACYDVITFLTALTQILLKHAAINGFNKISVSSLKVAISPKHVEAILSL
jgi:hypothetical protein